MRVEGVRKIGPPVRSAVLALFHRRWETWGLVLITLIAAALRFYRLDQLPPGLHYDEAFNGVNARALLEGGEPKLFYESNMGQEPMIIYLVAAAFALVGQAAWTVRLASAVMGVLTIPVCCWLGRELFQESERVGGVASGGSRTAASNLQWHQTSSSARAIGLGTALVLAILYWHLSFSRIGMEPILVPFFAGLSLASLMHGLHRGRVLAFVLAGFALGGCLYTYKAGYFVPLLVALFLGYATVVERGFLRRHGRDLSLAASVFLIVVLPLARRFVERPASFWQRPASVVLSPGLLPAGQGEGTGESLLSNLERVLGMFFVRGDANPRSNLPGRPVLDPFLALLFLIGLGRALVEAWHRRLGAALIVMWLVVMTLPTLITEYSPHFGRAIGATPAVAILCALGGWTVWQAARWLAASNTVRHVSLTAVLRERSTTGPTQAPGRQRRAVPIVVAVLLTLGVTFSAVSTVRAYFVTWGNSPDLFYAYDVGLVRLAGYLDAQPAGEGIYLTPVDREHYTLQFLVHRTVASFDGREGGVFPPAGQPATIAILIQEDKVTLPALEKARPDGLVAWTVLDGQGKPYAVVYHLPAQDQSSAHPGRPAPDHATVVSFGGAARLLGYSLTPATIVPGGSVTLILFWQGLAPMSREYTVFTHLIGPYNPATQGPVWAGHDGMPDGGRYRTTAWRPGEVILDRHIWTIPDTLPPGEYQIEAGFYLLETMERLPASTVDGEPLPGNAAILGAVRVAGTGE